MRDLLEKYASVLAESPLFSGMDEGGALELLAAVGAGVEERDKNGYFIYQGDEETDIYIVLEGRAEGESVSAGGELRSVNVFLPGDEFGDILSGSGERSPVSVRALGRCAAARLSFDSLLSARGAESARAQLLRNLVRTASRKYFALSRRVSLLLETRLKRRVTAYLGQLAEEQGGGTVTAPYDREGMARYLGCERSALSRELSRLRDEGAIEYKKNIFTLRDGALRAGGMDTGGGHDV